MRSTPSRVRLNGTKEFRTTEDGDKINAIRIIVNSKTYAKVDGVMVDFFTASVVAQVHDALSDENKKKFLSYSIPKMADIAFTLLKKGRKNAG